MSPKGETIKGIYIRVVSVGDVVAHGLEVVVLRVGTLYIITIKIRVSLVRKFM